MSRRTLAIYIDAGEKTCASAPAAFCSRLRVTRMGTRFVCSLFDGKELSDENGERSGPGWLQRLPECLAASGSGKGGAG
jgi:hypothetical protein